MQFFQSLVPYLTAKDYILMLGLYKCVKAWFRCALAKHVGFDTEKMFLIFITKFVDKIIKRVLNSSIDLAVKSIIVPLDLKEETRKRKWRQALCIQIFSHFLFHSSFSCSPTFDHETPQLSHFCVKSFPLLLFLFCKEHVFKLVVENKYKDFRLGRFSYYSTTVCAVDREFPKQGQRLCVLLYNCYLHHYFHGDALYYVFV